VNGKKEIRVRFAPSPTGHLHIGSLRTAIFNWLYARHTGGKYLLRIEDTDQARSTKEFLDSQLSSLKWFELESDEPAISQMSRLEQHKKTALDLLEKDLVYPCFCQPQDAVQKVVELGSGIGHKYDGSCRGKKWTEQDMQKPHAIRIKVPKDLKNIEFEDLIRGTIKVDADQLDDFVIVRRDGIPTYNFSVVVDDIFMRISHVIRGEDHISNTPKQILVYNALEAEKPAFAHLPLILGPSGNKLSKRDAAVSVEEYRKQGFLPDALFNYLVRLGWAHGDQEIFSREELVKLFTIEGVGKKGAIFDIEKLKWLNGVYLRNFNFEQTVKAIEDLGSDYKQELFSKWDELQLKKLFVEYAQRAETILQLTQDIINLASAPIKLDLNLISKWLKDKTVDLLQNFIEKLQDLEKLEHDNLLEIAKQTCSDVDLKLVCLAQPIRLALTGKIFSPGVFELIAILGTGETVKRLNLLINLLTQRKMEVL